MTIGEDTIEFTDTKQLNSKLSDPQYIAKQKERYDDIRKLLSSFNVPDIPEAREALLFFMFELRKNINSH